MAKKHYDKQELRQKRNDKSNSDSNISNDNKSNLLEYDSEYDDENEAIAKFCESDKDSEKFTDDETNLEMSDNNEEKETKPAISIKKPSNDAKEGRTIFIRNLPFECTEREVHNCFKQFGQIEYTRITINKDTKRSNGTAFVKFKKKKSVERSLSKQTQPNENKTNDNSLNPNGIYINGRLLNVCLAVPREEINEITIKSRKLIDKRNLYLAREGLIIEGTPAAAQLNHTEIERRSRA